MKVLGWPAELGRSTVVEHRAGVASQVSGEHPDLYPEHGDKLRLHIATYAELETKVPTRREGSFHEKPPKSHFEPRKRHKITPLRTLSHPADAS